MAPMAGITTPAFRRSVRRWGAGLVFTEMISSHGIAYGNRRTRGLPALRRRRAPDRLPALRRRPGRSWPRAAAVCVRAGADLVDVNMACPVRKVVKTGAGAALLAHARAGGGDRRRGGRTPWAPAVPVTVKMRAGLRMGDEAGRRMAPRLVAAGAAAVCIHPR